MTSGPSKYARPIDASTASVSATAGWREWLFSFPSRDARSATYHFDVPPDPVVELGRQIRL